MADGDVVFQAKLDAGALFAAALMRGLQPALRDVERVLKLWVAEYQRRVQRVTPVDKGLMRQSWFTQFERTSKYMSVTLANRIKSEEGAPYPLYLEFGTDRIAKGKVKAWRQGDEPIMEWPAKLRDIGNFYLEKDQTRSFFIPGGKEITYKERGVGKEGSAKFERMAMAAMRAFTAGQGEQMPMLRPIGYEIAPKVVEDVGIALFRGFTAAVQQRKAAG